MNIYELIVIFIINIILIYQNGSVSLWMGVYSNLLLFFINAILGTIVWYNISIFIDKSEYKIIKLLNSILSYIGKNSITFLCLNQLYIMCIRKFYKYIIICKNNNIKLILILLIVITTIILLICTNEILNKNKLKLLIGKRV